VGFEQIWAPWRLAYVKGEDSEQQEADSRSLTLLPGGDPDCFICQAVADGNDRQRHVVARTEHSIVLLNRYPYNNGHLLVAPRLHKAELDELGPEEQLDLSQTTTRMVGAIRRIAQPEGFNIGLNLGRAAGAGLPGHLHWHIVPRWSGDTNFMPVLGAVNVIPQALDAFWEALTEALRRT
jgi:ATP adenylyltransferase